LLTNNKYKKHVNPNIYRYSQAYRMYIWIYKVKASSFEMHSTANQSDKTYWLCSNLNSQIKSSKVTIFGPDYDLVRALIDNQLWLSFPLNFCYWFIRLLIWSTLYWRNLIKLEQRNRVEILYSRQYIVNSFAHWIMVVIVQLLQFLKMIGCLIRWEPKSLVFLFSMLFQLPFDHILFWNTILVLPKLLFFTKHTVIAFGMLSFI